MAIELPNGKISRTLPEQVGFNTKKIYDIIKWINDSDFIDKVLNLSDPSGTLTEAQYAIADLSPSYIVYGGKVFIKSLEDSDNIDFFKAGTDMSGSDSIVASVERVRIVKATKAYQYATIQLFESYNKTQLDSLLSAKANLSGATFTGEVKAPTFEQENYNEEIQDFLNITNAPAGVVFTAGYTKLARIGKLLLIVFNFKLENQNASDTGTFNIFTQLETAKIETLSQNTRDSIYDVYGQKLSEGTALGAGLITAFPLFETIAGYNEAANVHTVTSLRHNGVNSMSFSFNDLPSIPAGKSKFYTGRVFLTLD